MTSNNKELDQKSLEKYLWGAATALRGTIDAGDYKQYIFPLLFFKRVSDVYDEEFENALEESDGDMEYAAFAENHHFQIPEGAHWKDVRETTLNIGQALQNAMREIEKANPDTLTSIFGDASWTNKDRLSDEMLTNLIEHYSQQKLNLSNVPDDKLGNAYEYLIKEFADDSGHTAAEFYTNRTVVKLMTMIMDPQPGESVYDPTCGSGGLLLNCALHLKEEGKEYRTLKLYGQEINLLTSAIARMNMFMHGIEEFNIVRGNTLANPGFLENDELKKFNVILANPPYSIKSWDRDTFVNDPYGRNIWGTPPQGCADYAFQQHIQKSLDLENGRSISLWPHGVLFRDAEADMRSKMIEEDLVECVIGLGPNLFYNSPMEACLLITKTRKDKEKKNKILFINAVNEVKQEKTIGYLLSEHVNKIFNAYKSFKTVKGFSSVVSKNTIVENNGNLAINLYVQPKNTSQERLDTFASSFGAYLSCAENLQKSMSALFGSDKRLSHLKENSNFTLSKDGWKASKFGELVFEPKENTQSPASDGIEHVVGLDHLDSKDIHLRRSDNILEGTTFTKMFSKGDVLFGRRRAYLKKAVRADFSGICSGDITVIRSSGELLPELLPFVVNNERFFDFAMKHSAGGLSPRVKFKDLAKYRFHMPPMEIQRELSDLFTALDEVIESARKLDIKLKRTMLVMREKQLCSDSFKKIQLGEALEDIVAGKSLNGESTPVTANEKGVLKVSAVGAEGFSPQENKSLKSQAEFIERYMVNKGDVLITRANTKELVGRVCVVPKTYKNLMLSDKTLKLVFNEIKINKEYIAEVLNGTYARAQIEALATGTGNAMKNISQPKIRSIKIPLPDIKVQDELMRELNSIKVSYEKNRSKISSLINFMDVMAVEAFQE